MSDEMNQVGTPAAADAKKPGFLATTTGRIVAIVVGLGVLGIVAGIAVAIVLYIFGSQVVQEIEGQLETPPTAAESGESTEVVEAKAPAEEISNAELFTFRDIFEPLIRPASASATASTGSPVGSSPASDTVTPTTGNTLYLDSVVTENGVLKAQLRYNGAAYTLAPGGAIPNSPWQVLRVTSSGVTMLYGDVQVTLAVGQGITK